MAPLAPRDPGPWVCRHRYGALACCWRPCRILLRHLLPGAGCPGQLGPHEPPDSGPDRDAAGEHPVLLAAGPLRRSERRGTGGHADPWEPGDHSLGHGCGAGHECAQDCRRRPCGGFDDRYKAERSHDDRRARRQTAPIDRHIRNRPAVPGDPRSTGAPLNLRNSRQARSTTLAIPAAMPSSPGRALLNLFCSADRHRKPRDRRQQRAARLHRPRQDRRSWRLFWRLPSPGWAWRCSSALIRAYDPLFDLQPEGHGDHRHLRTRNAGRPCPCRAGRPRRLRLSRALFRHDHTAGILPQLAPGVGQLATSIKLGMIDFGAGRILRLKWLREGPLGQTDPRSMVAASMPPGSSAKSPRDGRARCWSAAISTIGPKRPLARPRSLGVQGWAESHRLADYAREEKVDEIVVALPWSADKRILEILRRLRHLPVPIRLAPEMIAFSTGGMTGWRADDVSEALTIRD